MKKLILFQTDNNLLPIGYADDSVSSESTTYELNKLITQEDYPQNYIKNCCLKNTASGYSYITDIQGTPVYPLIEDGGKACVSFTSPSTQFIYEGVTYQLEGMMSYMKGLFEASFVADPIKIEMPSPSEGVATKGVAEAKTQSASDINLDMNEAFDTLFGKMEEVLDSVNQINESKNSEKNYTEEQIISNSENLIPIEMLKELYADKYDEALEQGFFVNNSSLSYTIKKLRAIFDDSYIINNLLPKLEDNIDILKLLINSINSIDDIDKLIKGHKVLLKHRFNLQSVEAVLIDCKVKLFSGTIELDKEVIKNMLQNGLQNYNVALDRYNSSFEKVYDLNEKLLCPEFLVLPFNSNKVIGLVVTNCYVTVDNDKYFIPATGAYLDILKDLHFTEPLQIKNKSIDVDSLVKYTRVVSVTSLPTNLSTLDGIDEVIDKLREVEEFSDITLLPELVSYKNLINKEMC